MRIIFLFLIYLYSHLAFPSALLYPNEQIITVNHIQTLSQFSKGDPNKPLVIFVPGDSHLARIAYGYPGCKPQDFLNYWLNKKGYSFLGISYPLDNPVFSEIYPAFSIQDWAKQIAAVAKKTIQENKLTNHIIILGWSMGGSIEEAVNVAAKQQHLQVDLFIGLSSVPPIPHIMQSGPFATNTMLANKLADRKALFPWFIKSLKAQNHYNQHEIIPMQIYLKEFLGHIPTAISAEGYYYQNGKFIFSIEKTLKDSGVYNFAETPWIALIYEDLPSAAKISFIDSTSWNFMRAEMINRNYLAKKNLSRLSQENWKKLKTIINNLPKELTLNVQGNHFFFVGEKGAKATVEKIDILVFRAARVKNQIMQLTSNLN